MGNRTGSAARWALACLTCLVIVAPSSQRAHAGRDTLLGAVSSAELRSRNSSGKLEVFGRGGGVSLTYLDVSSPTLGFEGAALFLVGPDGERLYNLGLSMIGSTDLRKQPIAPFLSFGLDAASMAVPEGGRISRGMSVGVHGNIGLHALVSDFYLRGQVGFLGVGIGGVKGELSVGYQFD